MTAAALAAVTALTQTLFVFCACYAVVSDLRRLLIPNWIPVALVSAFPVFALAHLGADRIPAHLLVAVVVFAASLVFFIAGWMGGGDIKLLAALMLWVGPSIAPEFLLVMALLGAVLAIGLLLVRGFATAIAPWGESIVVRRVVELARLGQCPYGVAIGIAALLFAPRILGMV